MKEDYQKAFKKLTLFFLSNPVLLMDKVIKNKRCLELKTSHSSGHETSSFIRYILSDKAWWCNVKQFLSYSKNYTSKFVQVNLWHKLLHFEFSFWIWKVWKGREKIQKFEYLENEKSFLDERKNIFHCFKGLSFCEQIKIW